VTPRWPGRGRLRAIRPTRAIVGPKKATLRGQPALPVVISALGGQSGSSLELIRRDHDQGLSNQAIARERNVHLMW